MHHGAARAGGVEDVAGAADVDADEVLHPAALGHDGGGVDDGVGAAERRDGRRWIGDVGAAVGVAGDVDPDDLVAVGAEPVGQRGADEAGRAGDRDDHGLSVS